jgi:hypothetical protein
MDDKDLSIATQVAFKEASAHALALNLNLTAPDHQGVFEEMFSYMTQSLVGAIAAETATKGVLQAFPGTTAVQTHVAQNATGSASYVPPQPVAAGYGGPQGQQTFVPNVKVKGSQFGPLPDWLFEAAAEKNVTEVYDNRDRAMGTKRPWFKATTGGDQAVPFWPPRND